METPINSNIEKLISSYAEEVIVEVIGYVSIDFRFINRKGGNEINLTEYHIMSPHRFHTLQGFTNREFDQRFGLSNVNKFRDNIDLYLMASNKDDQYNKLLNELDFTNNYSMLEFVKKSILYNVMNKDLDLLKSEIVEAYEDFVNLEDDRPMQIVEYMVDLYDIEDEVKKKLTI